MNTSHQELLQKRLSELPFTDELKTVLDNTGFETLEDLLKLEVFRWHKEFAGFNFHHQQEIVGYIMKNNLSRYLKDE